MSRVTLHFSLAMMAALPSPYYSRPYSATPPPSANIAHPVPHQGVAPFVPSAGLNLTAQLAAYEDGKIYGLVIELMDPATREGALLELSKKREQYDDLALVLWHSFGEHRCLHFHMTKS